MSKNKIVKTACQLCPECCGVDVYVEDEKIVKVTGMREHKYSKGRLCPKGAAILKWVNSPDRNLYPLKRDKGDFKRITWDEALDTICAKLTHIQKEYGAESVTALMGMSLLEQGIGTLGMLNRFCEVFGTPNRFDVDSMCFRPRLIAYLHTMGKYTAPDVDHTDCMLVWANNPNHSMPVLSRRMKKRKEAGAKILAIDPRKTYWAKQADIHAQPRPGTDAALALGMLNVIIAEGLYDKEFVRDFTVGFDRLVEHIRSYPLDEVERITWVPKQIIQELARAFANTKPACIIRGGNALDQHAAGVQTSRAIAILQAVTGNLDMPGSFVKPPGLRQNSVELHGRTKMKNIAYDKYPLFGEIFGKSIFQDCQGMVIWDAILKGEPYPIKAMMVSGCNPALTFPNSKAVWKALERLEFLVVMDYFISETAKYADLVLPASTFMERYDLCDLYRMNACLPYVMMRKPAVQKGECWSDLKFWLELGKRMGYTQDFPWKDEKDVIAYLLEPSGIKLEDLITKHPEGIMYDEIKYEKDRGRGLRTPSGKVELYSETLKNLGYDPLPIHIEPPQSLANAPELAKEYPLILITGNRNLVTIHSRLKDIPHLKKRMPEPLAEIHPQTAGHYGLNDGDMTVVETKNGRIQIKVKCTEDILPGLVSVPHAWSEANANLLTDHAPADPVSGAPALKSLLCRVKKAA